HPIEVDVKDPAEIREIFDEISYSKGASILRMLERFLGEAAFRRGLRSYLREHSYGNARTEDLWRALEAASGKPVRAVMGTWTKQTGFPLLDVQITRKNGEARIALSQARFLYGHILGQPKERTTWKVPVHVARAGQRKPTIFLMEKPKASQSLGRSRRRPDDDWIKVNAGQSGWLGPEAGRGPPRDAQAHDRPGAPRTLRGPRGARRGLEAIHAVPEGSREPAPGPASTRVRSRRSSGGPVDVRNPVGPGTEG